MATTQQAPGGARVHVQRFGTFLSNMVMPNIGAFIAWGLITALFIKTGWIAIIGEQLGYSTAEHSYGFVGALGDWGDKGTGIVGPMITYLLPLLIGYTGGKIMYEANPTRGGVVGAIATMGAIAGASIPMFLGAMIMGPLGGAMIKRLDALWTHKIRPGFEMLVNNFSAGIGGGVLAVLGFVVAGPLVAAFSKVASNVVNVLISHNLLPLTSVFIEPAKILFLNNAVNHGILTPLGISQAADKGQSVLFLLEANPGPGLGLLLAFALFGKGLAKASAPGAILIQFVGGIHEIYFPYVLMKPKLLLAVILGGASGIGTNVAFGSGLRSPASPGSIIAVWAATPPSAFFGVTLSVLVAAAVTFTVAAFLLRMDSEDDGDLAGATSAMEARKGKTSSISGALLGGSTTGTRSGPIRSIVFACDAGMGSSAMGASVLRKKIRSAGFHDVTIVNLAISNLSDTVDLVVTHQALTDRARLRTASALHVSVDNFMASPRYDEIVELLQSRNTTGAEAPPAGVEPGLPSAEHLLTVESIVLDAPTEGRDAAITRAGQLLVDAGAVDASYVVSMHTREASVSTHMGNLLAIPHGTNDAKGAIQRSAMSFVRYPHGIDWNGKPVTFVIGIAGIGNDHLALLRRIAEIFVDPEQVARLEAAHSPTDILDVLGVVQPA